MQRAASRVNAALFLRKQHIHPPQHRFPSARQERDGGAIAAGRLKFRHPEQGAPVADGIHPTDQRRVAGQFLILPHRPPGDPGERIEPVRSRERRHQGVPERVQPLHVDQLVREDARPFFTAETSGELPRDENDRLPQAESRRRRHERRHPLLDRRADAQLHPARIEAFPQRTSVPADRYGPSADGRPESPMRRREGDGGGRSAGKPYAGCNPGPIDRRNASRRIDRLRKCRLWHRKRGIKPGGGPKSGAGQRVRRIPPVEPRHRRPRDEQARGQRDPQNMEDPRVASPSQQSPREQRERHDDGSRQRQMQKGQELLPERRKPRHGVSRAFSSRMRLSSSISSRVSRSSFRKCAIIGASAPP